MFRPRRRSRSNHARMTARGAERRHRLDDEQESKEHAADVVLVGEEQE